ncbi:DUF1801 domain-containing protein [Microbacterium sp. gxy059]|uniref:DUF1801 domain-containing protein n=1 Tax=Microbacterium sp. gxy059 TaxID=2957199 RepID=UPI003D971260
MEPTGGDLDAFLEKVAPARRRDDARRLVALFREATGEDPVLWGSIVGFGSYHYRYASGREGDGPAAAFAPRRQASTVYLSDGVGAHEEDLARLGPHTTGVGCLYLKDLAQIDLDVLARIVRRSHAALTAGVFGDRARDA